MKFEWLFEHVETFCNIKQLMKNYSGYKSIIYDNSNSVILIADASNQGIGSYFGQRKNYKTMVPAGFYSRIFLPV